MGVVTPIDALIGGGPLASIYAALDAQLQAAFPAANFRHAMLPHQLTQEAWDRVTRTPPVVGLGLVKVVPEPGLGRRFRGTSVWQVLLITRNATLPLQLLGDAARPGLFGMMCMAAAALQGITIDGAGSVQLGDAGPVYSDKWANEELAVAAFAATVPFTLLDATQLGQVDDFLRLGVIWEGAAPLPPEVDDVRDDAA